MDAGQSVEYVDADHFEALGALLHSAERRLENKSALSTATAAVGGKRQAALSPGTLKVQEQQHPQQQAGQCRALFHSSTGSNGWADAAAGQHAALQQNSTVSGASRPDLQPQLHVQPQHPPQQQHQNHQQHHILTEPTAQQQELPARNTHKLTPASAGAAGVQAGGCGSVAHQLPADQQHAGVQFQQAHGAVQQQQGQHTGWQQPAAGHAHAAEQLRPAQSQQQQQHEQLDLQHNRTKSHGGQPLMQPPAGPQVQVQQQSHPGQQRQVQHWQQQAGLQAQRQQQQQPLPPPPPQQAGHSGQVQQLQWQQQQRQHQQQVHLHAPVQAPSFTVSGALLPVISAAAPCTGSSGGSAQQQQQQQHTNHHPTCGAAAGAACGSKAGSSGVCSGGGKCRTPFGPSAGSGGQKLVRHTAGSSGGASCTAGAHKQVVAGGSSCNRNAGSVAAHAVAQCAGNGGVGATGCAAAGTDTAVMAAAASPAAVADYEACVGSNSSRVDASYVSNSTDAQRVGWAACQQLGDLQGGMNHSSRSMRVSFSGGSSRSRGGSAAGSGGEQSDLKRSNSWSAGQWQQQPLLQQQQHRSSQQQQQQQWPRQQQQHRVIQGHPHGSCHQGSRPQQQQQPISQQQEGVQPPSRPPGQQQQQHDWQQWQVHLQNTVPPQEAPAAHLQQVQLPPQQQPGGSCQQSSKASAAAALAATARHYPPLPAAVTAAPGSQPLPAAVAAGAQLLPPPAPAEAATAAGPHLPPPPAAAAAAAGAAGCGAGTAAVRRKLPSSLAAQRGRGPGSGGGGNGSSSMPGSCAGGGSGGGGSGGGYSGGYSGGGGSGGGRCVQQQQWGAGQQQLGAVVRGPKQLPWAGRVRYACTAADVDAACRHMLAAGPTVIGFDVEWKPSFVKGAPPNKAALVQLAYACRGGHDCRTKVEDQGRGVVVLLLHIAHSGITQKLQEVLLDDQIVKLGVNINGDIIKLAADYGTKVFGASDLSDTAHGHQLRAVAGVTANVQPKKWSLAGLIEEVFNLELPKPQHIRMGDWERRPLTAEQQRYAAMDAYACLLLHWELQQLPTKQTLSQQLIEKMRERAGVDEDED